MAVKETRIAADQDDHVWISIQQGGLEHLDIDIHRTHGYRTLSIRVDGLVANNMVIGRIPGPGKFERYCPFCGDEINIVSSKTHVCKEEGK